MKERLIQIRLIRLYTDNDMTVIKRIKDSISDPLVIGSILRNSPRVTNPESKESLFINKTIN